MTYSRELSILRDHISPTVKGLMDNHGAFIAGGAVTSVFSSERINDLDLFFPTAEAADAAIETISQKDRTASTDAAISFVSDKHRVQLTRVKTGDPSSVIGSFDFTICQAAFNGSDFLFSPDFFQHLAQRRLVYNINAEYPLCSLFRTRKFIQRGYRFSGIEAIKLGLCLNNLKIRTYADLRKQLLGIDTLLLADLTASLKGEEEKTYEFNDFTATLEGWLERLETLTGSEEKEA
jgi:hypothetical protein